MEERKSSKKNSIFRAMKTRRFFALALLALSFLPPGRCHQSEGISPWISSRAGDEPAPQGSVENIQAGLILAGTWTPRLGYALEIRSEKAFRTSRSSRPGRDSLVRALGQARALPRPVRPVQLGEPAV